MHKVQETFYAVANISVTVRPRITVGNENPLNYVKIDREHRMTTN